MEPSSFGYLPGWRDGTTNADRDVPGSHASHSTASAKKITLRVVRSTYARISNRKFTHDSALVSPSQCRDLRLMVPIHNLAILWWIVVFYRAAAPQFRLVGLLRLHDYKVYQVGIYWPCKND